eukprot:TRINITY_DN26470_c0_g1_i1.p1 TRINITY_DN26470_c0_g1~~TRINITY_DN26470_c0_g1_i1.p1  ORF type:complete len:517 (+),score=153.60 TRINITY_DN26470_c0_g1_i1:79-1551(+)
MSGIFWEPDHQPDLCEAVSGYTLSTVNLAVAIPMAAVDLLCSAIIFIATLAMMVLNPALDCFKYGGAVLLELLGVESWNHNTTIVSLLVTYHLIVVFTSNNGTGSFYQKSFSRLNFYIMSIIWLISFISFPVFENAVFSQVALLSVALQVAENGIKFLFLEYNNFASEPKQNSMDGIASGFLSCIRMEVFAALIIGAFGYPSFSKEDDVTQYFCVVPLLALQMIYFTSVSQTESPDSHTPLPHCNDSFVEETILESDLKVQEVKENITDEVVPEENVEEGKPEEIPIEDETEKEDDTPNEDDTPKEGIASEIVAAVNTAAAVADVVQEKVGEVKEVVEEKVEEITEEVKEKLSDVTEEAAQIIKEDALFKRVQTGISNLLNLAQAPVLKVTNPVLIIISKLLSTLVSLPWMTILLFTFSNSSHFLWSYAWLHLTGNPLAYSLPVFSLLLPLLLPKLPMLPPQARHVTGEICNLAMAGVQYSLITTEEIEE